ncbi:ribosome biogenesis protein WDR12 homolog isoform X2 [Diachasma alloeum]|uniref:ribosome biogenesis protein WDR12 homolog isoform X2 n=1 Tax=Diachasma alloeum TaxID=454923 RepID=UPI0007382908|nr:ribosome biogenesis protein WDR12 homolog isoform X2 [Diachasma alloeum]
MAGTSTSSDVPQLQIRFITKQECYAVPDYPLSVPAPITPEDLNTLLNTLLRETVNLSASISFDFLVSSEFLRSPLSTHISDRGLSTEDVILIEYLEKHPPPEPQNCLLHDDWVASVAVAEKWILTGNN